MKKSVISAVLAAAVLFCTSAYAAQYPLSIRESEVLKENTDYMLGSNFEWERHFSDFLNSDLSVNKAYAEVMGDYTLPMSRMAGSSSRVFQWKGAIGPYANRPTQFNGYANVRICYGLLEWINHVRTVNPNVKLTYSLNMETGTTGDAADLAEFLLGDGNVNYNGSTNWAEKRKSYGVSEPVQIDIWELGNEVDAQTVLGPQGMTKEAYVKKAKEYIQTIKAIDPNAVFAACGHTRTYSNSEESREWNRYVLQQLGDQIDYLTVHLYYTQYDIGKYPDIYMQTLKEMLDEISPNVKLYYSEHSTYIKDFNDSAIKQRTHGMYGTLATSEFFNRVMIRPEVYAANYHCMYAPNWSEFYIDSGGKLQATPIADMLKLYEEYSLGSVVKSTLEGYKTGTAAGVTSMTVTDDGYLNIIVTNQTAESAEIPFAAERDYIMTQRSEIYADTSIENPAYADNWYDSDTGVEKHEVYKNTEYYQSNELCDTFSVKPYSLTAVRLKAAEPVDSKIYVASYGQGGKLKKVRVINDYQFITDSGAITAANLKPGEKAYVWNEKMQPVTRVLTLDMLPGSSDNDIRDEWDF